MDKPQPLQWEQSGEASDTRDLLQSILRLRKRSWMLRVQAFTAIGVLVIASCAIAWIFMSMHRISNQSTPEIKARDPYDYGLMESRHAAIAAKLQEFSEMLSDARQELITDKYGKLGANHALVLKLLQTRSEELSNLRNDLQTRLTKDRENMYREILQLRTERNKAVEDGAEKRSYISLIGEAVMRVGVLVLAIYLISIISNIAKYWLRVADHLNSIADSLDLLRGAGLSLQPAIAALTPHPIDFQTDELAPAKSLKSLLSMINSITHREIQKSD